MESFRDMAHQERLANDLDNLRAALDWAVISDPVAAIDLLRFLSPIWTMLALGREVYHRAEVLLEVLAALPPAGDEAVRNRKLARAFGLSMLALGSAASGGGKEAYDAAEEAATMLREDGQLPVSLADTLFWQAILGVETGQAGGHAAARESYEIGYQLQNQVLQVVGLVALARWELVKGDMPAAANHLDEASRLRAVIGIPTLNAYQAYTAAMVARANGDFEAAYRVLEEGVEALHQARHRIFANVLDSELGHTHRQSGDLAGAAEIYRHTIREWQELGHRAAVANQLECFAFIAISEKMYARAARLFGAAERLRDALSSSMTPVEKKEYDAYVAALSEAMEPDSLQEAWQAGRGLDLDTAVTYALSEGEDDDG